MKQQNNDWKSRLNIVYSTNPNFAYETEQQEETATLPPQQQKLHVQIERRNRGGKSVTLISGFVGTEDALRDLGKLLKTKCGVGGSAKDGEIIIQGEWLDKVKTILQNEGFRVK